MIRIYAEEEKLKPIRANDTDAGLDLRAKYDISIAPAETKLVPTGVYVDFSGNNRFKTSWDKVGLLAARSSLAKKGLCLANSVGIIDVGYRGEICVLLHNFSNMLSIIDKYERVAQLIILDCYLGNTIFVDTKEELSYSDRGVKGFGSSGKY